MRNVTNFGDTPHQVFGTPTDYKRLFYSDPEAALAIPIAIRQGFGVIPAGTLMAINGSASTDYEYFPYIPANPTAGQAQIKASIVTYAISATAAGADVVVSLDDSYRFNVGDDLIIDDSGTAAENLGAIVSITRTESSATITATVNVSGTFTTSEYLTCYTEGAMGSTGTPWMEAKGILMHTVDAGTGVNAKGAQGVLVVSNAILYKGLLTNYDSAALTDLGTTLAVEHGQFLIMK